jgi:hypothetical protein
MNTKAKTKTRRGKGGTSKLKSRRSAASKSRSSSSTRKKPVSKRKRSLPRTHKKTAIAKSKASRGDTVVAANRIVRIMGQGQFTVDTRTLKKLNELDNAIVGLVSTERSDDSEFKKKLTELNHMVVNDGKPLDPHQIIKSDIILPSPDLSIDEAKKLFKGEGVIPEV